MGDFLKIMWLIGLIIIFIILSVAIASNRDKDNEEDFRRNFKIGVARTLGALVTIFFITLIIETIMYVIIFD